MIEDREVVAIASFDSLPEAEVARSHLATEGIAVTFRERPAWPDWPGETDEGLVVCVAREDAERAREVIAHLSATDLPEEEAPAGADGP